MTVKSIIKAAPLMLMMLFAQNAGAQAKPQKDTIFLKTIRPDKNINGYWLVTEKNDSLKLWSQTNEYESASLYPTVKTEITGYKADDRAVVTIETSDKVYTKRNILPALAVMMEKNFKLGTTALLEPNPVNKTVARFENN